MNQGCDMREEMVERMVMSEFRNTSLFGLPPVQVYQIANFVSRSDVIVTIPVGETVLRSVCGQLAMTCVAPSYFHTYSIRSKISGTIVLRIFAV